MLIYRLPPLPPTLFPFWGELFVAVFCSKNLGHDRSKPSHVCVCYAMRLRTLVSSRWPMYSCGGQCCISAPVPAARCRFSSLRGQGLGCTMFSHGLCLMYLGAEDGAAEPKPRGNLQSPSGESVARAAKQREVNLGRRLTVIVQRLWAL